MSIEHYPDMSYIIDDIETVVTISARQQAFERFRTHVLERSKYLNKRESKVSTSPCIYKDTDSRR